MPATTSINTIWAAQTLTAGAGNTTSASEDVRTNYGGTVTLSLTNGATGPTVPAFIRLEISYDNSAWYNWTGDLTAGVANSTTYTWTFAKPIGTMYVRAVAGGNTGQDVTANAVLSEVTAL